MVASVIHRHELVIGVHVSLHGEHPSHLPPHPIPLGYPSVPALRILFHASNLDWSSISHMVIYMFQCYSYKSSHPRLLPWVQKSVFYTCVSFAIFAHRVVITIFLIPYICVSILYWCFFLAYFTLYNGLQFHQPH